MPKLIYIAGPYSVGDVALNVRTAIDTADELAQLGYIPIVPHLSHFWHMIHFHTHKFWLDYAKAIIHRCDAVLRLPGFSKGADAEEEYCVRHSIPLFYSIDELMGQIHA